MNPNQSRHLNDHDLLAAKHLALGAALDVAHTLKEHFGNTPYTLKSHERDWVTKWDAWAEENISAKLDTFALDVGVLGEELGGEEYQPVFWTVDAIDGTSWYVRGEEKCTTMISLVDSGVPVVSVINDFVRERYYYAVDGQGAYTNDDQAIKVSKRPINTSYIETYVSSDEDGEMVNTRLRAAGSYILQEAAAGYTFISIAQGKTEGFVSYHNPFATIWDYAPGALLVHEAGGVVQNVGSESYSVYNADMIASNAVAHQALRQAVELTNL